MYARNVLSIFEAARRTGASCISNTVRAVTDTRPLFKNVDHALRFAYTIHLYPAYPESELKRLFKIHTLNAPGMTPMDWHAQGAMIRTHCSTKLHKVGLAYVECWYGDKGEYFDGLHRIVEHTLPQVIGTGTVQRRLILDLVKRHFQAGSPRRRTYLEIAAKTSNELKVVEKFGLRVNKALNSLSLKVDAVLSVDFEQMGIC